MQWYTRSVRNRKQILFKDEQEWEWGLDCIFPSVIEIPDTTPNKLGRFYLYYSCHDPPAGIGLAYADSLIGPWYKYRGNPILTRSCHRGLADGHVSSPHVLLDPSSQQFTMYYHGLDEWINQRAIQTTGIAVSTDGIAWKKEGEPCVDADDDTGWNSGELSYARVTKLTSGVYTMVYMARNRARSNPVLGCAHSHDGRKWRKDTSPLLCGGGFLQAFISSGQIIEVENRTYLLFCDEDKNGCNTTIKVQRLTPQNVPTGEPKAILAPRKFPFWDRMRVHDPYLFYSDGGNYLFYAAGNRANSKGIGITPTTQPHALFHPG